MTIHAGQDPTQTHVAIFGGGVAGLTAAHELARRGFRVSVYDAAKHFGGMAASQYRMPPAAQTGPAGPEVPSGTPGALAGEHGFRFFPSFYRHLNDTMGRIPLFVKDDPDQGEIRRRGTVRDRLKPTNTQGVGLDDGRDLFSYRRGDVDRTLESVLDELATTMDYLGATDQDIFRLLFKLVQYMSSSDLRRRALEDVSWWTFVDGESFSPRMRRYIDTVPRALVAMSAKKADARTQGNVLLQLSLDQLGDPDEVDRTLDGPTSERWIKPWVVFLKSLGVQFHTEVAFQGFKPNIFNYGSMTAVTSTGDVTAHAYVLAIPYDGLQTLFQSAPISLADLHAMDASTPVVDDSLARLDAFPSGDDPAGPLALMSGIQYFLQADVKFVPGHVYYPDSPWGLSSISQAQFWGEGFPEVFDGFGGVLSVDIGEFDVPGRGGLTVRQCTADQIAREVWLQLRVATRGNQFLRVGGGHTRWPGALPAKAPVYLLDRYLEFSTLTTPATFSDSTVKMLINRPGEYALRPGHPDLYRLHLDQIVMAGPWMQTWTRLTTMEAANESARHAVNALLTRIGYPGQFCSIWNPEDHEPVKFDRLKSLDERLVACGVPHVFEALGVYDWICRWIPTTPYTHQDRGTHAPAASCEPQSDCCDPTPLDRLQTITGMDLHQLSAIFELCPEDLLEAERRVKNLAGDARAADHAHVRDWMEGRSTARTLGGEHWALLAELAGRELSGELMGMMQQAAQAATDARERAGEPDEAKLDYEDEIPVVAPLSKLGLGMHAELMAVARGRLRREGQDKATSEAVLGPLGTLLQRYLPGYIAHHLETEQGATMYAAWRESLPESEELPERWAVAEDRPAGDAPLDLDALAEAERILPGLFPVLPGSATVRGRTHEAGGATDGPTEGATDGSSDGPVTRFSTDGKPDDVWLSSEIVPNLPRVRPWRRRRGRALPGLLAGLADRRRR